MVAELACPTCVSLNFDETLLYFTEAGSSHLRCLDLVNDQVKTVYQDHGLIAPQAVLCGITESHQDLVVMADANAVYVLDRGEIRFVERVEKTTSLSWFNTHTVLIAESNQHRLLTLDVDSLQISVFVGCGIAGMFDTRPYSSSDGCAWPFVPPYSILYKCPLMAAFICDEPA